jgi:hypothetical protein
MRLSVGMPLVECRAMRKWFVAAVNILLGAFAILIWVLERKQGTENYNDIMKQDIPKIILSFTVLTFLVLIMSIIKNKNRY